MDKAVILARGLGRRMRKADGSARLSAAQSAVADSGLKAMIPIGRPFLDYSLSALADAGYRRVCLVIGPEHDAVRTYYTTTVRPARIAIDFAIQERPLGTADAVASAREFARDEPFLCINSDNYYPPEALAALREVRSGMALAAFERQALIAQSNIPADRVAQFAVVRSGPEGLLERIIEKPSPAELAAMGEPVRVSMNCWRLGPAIFEACLAIGLSPRGELELPDAVQYAVARMGERFAVLPFRQAVLDLSGRQDISAVASRLSGVNVSL